MLAHTSNPSSPPLENFPITDNAARTNKNSQASIDAEAYLELVARAGKTFGKIPSALIAAHILRMTPDCNWPVRLAALQALERRMQSCCSEKIRVSSSPRAGTVLGQYETTSSGKAQSSYVLRLESVEPIVGRCTCADFRRNSLGLCKHLFSVLQRAHRSASTLARASQESSKLTQSARLVFNPWRSPLQGADILSQLCWHDGSAPSRLAEKSKALLKQHFGTSENGVRRLKQAPSRAPQLRLALVRDLQQLLGSPRQPSEQGSTYDPVAKSLLNEEAQRLLGLKVLEQLRQGAALRKWLSTLKIKLHPYQESAVRHFLERGRLLLADDMGLGKTIQASAICHVVYSSKAIRRGLLIVPASLKAQWLREWSLCSDTPIECVEGSAEQRCAALNRCTQGFLLMNYEQVTRDFSAIQAYNPELVVLDEGQRIKNWQTKTALFVKGLTPAYRLVLTGTPMENRLNELVSIIEWVDSYALEPKWRLNPFHTCLSDGHNEVSGIQHLPALRERLAPCMLRRRRDEVLADLPSRSDAVAIVPLTATQVEEHDAYREPISRLIQISKRRPLLQAEFLRLMQCLTQQRLISNGMALPSFDQLWPEISSIAEPSEEFLLGLSSPKLVRFRELVEELVLRQQRKLVVFSQWRHMLLLAQWTVAALLARHKLRSAFFSGQESQKRRSQNVIEFHDDRSLCLLFATDAGGVGLNLQRAANCCVNLELPWNPAVLEQRVARIHRMGQTSPINVYNLVGDYGIEQRILGLIGSKRALFQGLFDGDSEEIIFSEKAGFIGKLERLMEDTPQAPASLVQANKNAQQPEEEVLGEGLALQRDDALVSAEGNAPQPFSLEPQVSSAAAPGLSAREVQPPALSTPAEVQTDGNAEAESRMQVPLAACAAPAAALNELAEAATPLAPEVAAKAANDLLATLRVQTAADGSISISAAPQAASLLAGMFEQMAKLLRAGERAA